MRKLIKWVGKVLAGILIVAILAGFGFYFSSEARLNKSCDANIYNKMQVTDRVQAAIRAREAGMGKGGALGN